jgi:hypothetical protein
MENSRKYPKTCHFSFSPGCARDDKVLKNVQTFFGHPLIMTEKMDGSNVCLESDNVFARSHNAKPNHPSFAPLKALHASVRSKIPIGLQVLANFVMLSTQSSMILYQTG